MRFKNGKAMFDYVSDGNGKVALVNQWVDAEGNVIDDISKYTKDQKETLWDNDELANITGNLEARGIDSSDFFFVFIQQMYEQREDFLLTAMSDTLSYSTDMIKRYLADTKLGVSATISEYYSSFLSNLSIQGVDISSKDNIGGRPTDDSNENNSTVTTKTNDGNSNPKPSTT